MHKFLSTAAASAFHPFQKSQTLLREREIYTQTLFIAEILLTVQCTICRVTFCKNLFFSMNFTAVVNPLPVTFDAEVAVLVYRGGPAGGGAALVIHETGTNTSVSPSPSADHPPSLNHCSFYCLSLSLCRPPTISQPLFFYCLSLSLCRPPTISQPLFLYCLSLSLCRPPTISQPLFLYCLSLSLCRPPISQPLFSLLTVLLVADG